MNAKTVLVRTVDRALIVMEDSAPVVLQDGLEKIAVMVMEDNIYKSDCKISREKALLKNSSVVCFPFLRTVSD